MASSREKFCKYSEMLLKFGCLKCFIMTQSVINHGIRLRGIVLKMEVLVYNAITVLSITLWFFFRRRATKVCPMCGLNFRSPTKACPMRGWGFRSPTKGCLMLGWGFRRATKGCSMRVAHFQTARASVYECPCWFLLMLNSVYQIFARLAGAR